jgi:CDP-diacylglycerol---glycerol-3-phosphate 3-phosphatidyltransferase
MNLANKLTILRIFLVPIFMLFLLERFQYGLIIAVIIFTLAALTDSLDGYIARSRNQITRFGKFIDPLADKLLVSAALISLVQMQMISAWVAMIIIGREFIISGLRVVAASDGIVIAASGWGKLKTISQIVAIIAMLVTKNYPINIFAVPVSSLLMSLAVAFTVISGLDYLYINREILKTGLK